MDFIGRRTHAIPSWTLIRAKALAFVVRSEWNESPSAHTNLYPHGAINYISEKTRAIDHHGDFDTGVAMCCAGC
jgi:hypothetical protein